MINKQIEKIDQKLFKLIENSEQYQLKNEIIQSMSGVGKIVALTLLCDMPELGYLTNKQSASLVGVAPINKESGSFKGKRGIRGGRYQIRSVMFMGMMSGIQCNPVFKATAGL